MSAEHKEQTGRVGLQGVDSQFVNRWSPRAFTGKTIEKELLLRLFEAARWAPSAYNNQPWRFLYADRDSVQWKNFLELLVPQNQLWAAYAGALILIISKKSFDFNGKPSRSHSFDAGAAWYSLALQASLIEGIAAHACEGFDVERARALCAVPGEYEIEYMVVVGYVGGAELLPEELRAQELPNQRKELSELVAEGRFCW